MLEQCDWQRIEKLMEEKNRELTEDLQQMIDERDRLLLKTLEEKYQFLLEEIGVTQTFLEKRIDRDNERLDRIEVFYRTDKLDSDTLSLLVRQVNELSRCCAGRKTMRKPLVSLAC